MWQTSGSLSLSVGTQVGKSLVLHSEQTLQIEQERRARNVTCLPGLTLTVGKRLSQQPRALTVLSHLQHRHGSHVFPFALKPAERKRAGSYVSGSVILPHVHKPPIETVAQRVVTLSATEQPDESVRLTLTLRVSRHATLLSVRPHTVLTACVKSRQRVVRKYPEADVSTLRTMRHARYAAEKERGANLQ